jgi:lipoprotein NlpD
MIKSGRGKGWLFLLGAMCCGLLMVGCVKREPRVPAAADQTGPSKDKPKCGLICVIKNDRQRAKDPIHEESITEKARRSSKTPKSKSGALERLRERLGNKEPESFSPSTTRGVYHIVKKGETLWRICQTYGVGVEEVCRVNQLKDPSNLSPGQSLWIPGADRVVDVPPATASNYDYPAPGGDYSPGEPDITLPRGAKGSLLFPVPGGEISSGFGARRSGHTHEGVDIVAPMGTSILAADDGKVVYADNKIHGYGNMIIIKHAGNLVTVYAHNSKNLVGVGDLVKRGQKIAEVGQTGKASCPHCHFEVRIQEKAVDPMGYLQTP